MANLLLPGQGVGKPDSGSSWPVTFCYLYFPQISAFATGLVSAILGLILLRSAGQSQREIIPRQDRELLYKLLLDKNDSGLNNYVKLTSLTGIVGLCTKLGIGGLPFATIALTIFFSLMGLFSTANSGFFDLAKLTLGAFIGSYVQRARVEFSGNGDKDKRELIKDDKIADAAKKPDGV